MFTFVPGFLSLGVYQTVKTISTEESIHCLTRSLPTTSYLVVLGSFIFANYEITRISDIHYFCNKIHYFCQLRDNLYYIIFNFSFIYSKTNGFYYFCWKTKNTKNPYPGFSNIFKETFSVLPCYEISHSTEYGLIEISVINS